jgi:hypothetical protein
LIEEAVLDPFAGREAGAQTIREPGLVEDTGVDLSDVVLADAGVGQAQDVEVGAVVHRVPHLPPGEQCLQRERSRKSQDRLRVRGGVERVAHDLVDESGHAEEMQTLDNARSLNKINVYSFYLN